MTRTEKEAIVNELSTAFAEQGAVIVCDYKGMTVEALEGVRALARENAVQVRVIKNTLAGIALKNAGCEEMELVNTNVFIWGEDQIATCKVADKSAEANKDNFSIKSGVIESKVADINTINAMAKLPGRDELLGMLLNVWNAPVRNFTIGMSALAEKLEEEA
ncbi:50S ribosomal protein L10 [Sulfurovum sp. bin170]|uniref:50S ribosomal protein L10 n=1 Tax=Sulfurovum sp. bin170 TaxID=2695268 RepID=UPI0013DE842B|nr:50S ribosomal protein L10 [Sulfurovum sp. bin170]NEW61415.1 50S ribosomal protein L10 [Sulfurovum sp. bin170]